MARHVLILRVHGAAGRRMLLEALPGRFDNKTGPTKIRNAGTPDNLKIALFGVTRWGHLYL